MASKRRYNRVSRSHGDLKQLYADWHWGLPAGKIVTIDDPLYPDRLVECGRLHYLYVDIDGKPKKRPKKQTLKDPNGYEIEIEDRHKDSSFLGFDPDHPHQRLYIVLPRVEREAAKAAFWDPGNATTLSALARKVGGRHARDDYPKLRVTPIGTLLFVVYHTAKKGDGESSYIHEMGEEGGIPPVLAVDSTGRLWIAGGSYTCPEPGITQ